MKTKTFTIISDFDGLALQGALIEPHGEKKAIVQIVHGMCEYKERYFPFMQFLAEHGYIAVCHDQRGHGDSVLPNEPRGFFGDYDGVAIVDDAAQVTEYLKTRYPGLKVFLFGHSMGSMVVRCYLREYDVKIDKLVVCGSPSENPLAGVAIGLEKTVRLFRGARHTSKMLAYLSTGKGDENFPNEGKDAWLSHNHENIQEFQTNPKSNFTFTCNGFENLFKLMKRTYTKKGYRLQNVELPIRFIAGSDDAVIGSEDQWLKAIGFLREVGYKNVSGKLYHGLRHELLNEMENEQVYADLLAFFD